MHNIAEIAIAEQFSLKSRDLLTGVNLKGRSVFEFTFYSTMPE